MAPGRKKGTPKTGGRSKGMLNKVTLAIRDAALQHGPDAVAELARLMNEGQTEHVRIAACREILDRAYGKSRQSIEHTGHNSGPITVMKVSDRERMRRLACFLLEDQAVALDEGGKIRVNKNLGPGAHDARESTDSNAD